MAAWGSHLDPDVDVSLLGDSRRSNNTIILLGKPSCSVPSVNVVPLLLRQHLPPSSTSSKNAFSPYVSTRCLLSEAAP